MPSLHGLKESIDNTLMGLLDFSTHALELTFQIKLLIDAIENKPVDESSFLYTLAQCLMHPSKRLYRIEHFHTDDVPIGFIQRYILDCITSHLTDAAKIAKIDLSKLWNHQTILAKESLNITNHDRMTFVSERSPFDLPPHPEAYPVPEEKIYTMTTHNAYHVVPKKNLGFYSDVYTVLENVNGEIQEIQDFYGYVWTPPDHQHPDDAIVLTLYVDLNINLIPVITKSEPIIMLPNFHQALNKTEPNNNSELDAADNRFRFMLREEVLKKADEIAALTIAKHLQLSSHAIKEINASISAKSLISDYYYFELIKSHFLPYKKILHLSPQAVETLKNPVMIKMMREHIINFDEAAALTREQRNVVLYPVFSKLIFDHAMTKDIMSKIDQALGYFLIHSTISELIKKEKISLARALIIPEFLRPYFAHSNQVYTKYFKEHHINWHGFCSLRIYHCPMLNHPRFIQLLLAGLVSFQQLSLLHVQALNLLTHYPEIFTYIEEKKLKLDEVNYLQCYHLPLLEHPPFLFLSLKGTLKPHQLGQLSENCVQLLKKDERFFNAINHHFLTIQELSALSNNAIKLIEKFPHLVNWINAGIIQLGSLNHCHDENFFTLYVNAYYLRLKRIYANTPFVINHEIDSANQIRQELSDAARDCKTDILTLHAFIVSRLIDMIQHDLEKLASTYDGLKKTPVFKQFINTIKHDEPLREVNWQMLFSNLVKLASDTLHQLSLFSSSELSSSPTPLLFSKKIKKNAYDANANIRNLCIKILNVVEINNMPHSLNYTF